MLTAMSGLPAGNLQDRPNVSLFKKPVLKIRTNNEWCNL